MQRRKIEMKYLTKEYWTNFQKDGKLFEKLSKTLIEYEYGVTDFTVVGGPGDGGKDIYKEVSLLGDVTTEIWAQCKYYHESLSFDDISYTLLMAYLKNTNQILIFSYSKVTPSFTENLNEYRRRTDKNIVVYSDENLERLILKHRAKLYEHHKDYFTSFPDDITYKWKEFEWDYQIYINDILLKSKTTSINLNSICELVITITNKTSKEQNVKIQCVKNSAYSYFEFIEDIQDTVYAIPSHNTKVFKFHIKPNKYISKTQFPKFRLIANEKTIEIKSTKTLRFRWLADTALIGSKYYNALQQIKYGVRYSHFHLIYIYGTSGVGKTRILREAERYAVQTGKKLICIDSEKNDFSYRRFLEIICSKITELPLFKDSLKFVSNVNDSMINYAARILYDEKYDITQEWEQIAKFLADVLTKKDYVLELDNLQHFDKLSLTIIERLITYLKNSQSKSTIILGINTDYIYEHSVFDEFFHRLKRNVANNPQFYTGIQLYGFEGTDSELFIRECLSYQPDYEQTTRIHYENAVKKMVEYCGANPFYIQQYLLYLAQKEIIKRGKTTLYYIYNLDGFFKSFYEIPQNIEGLILHREKFLTEHLSDDLKKQYSQLIYLVNLTKALPQTIYYEIFNDSGLLDILLNLGFLTITEGYISPIHSYYTVFYSSNYKIQGIPQSLLEQFITAADKLLYKDELALPYFWAKYRLGSIDSSALLTAVRKISDGNFDCISYLFCLKSICQAVEQNRNMFNIHKYLNIYERLCSKIDETIGIKESAYYYEKFTTRFVEDITLFSDIAKNTIEFITHYLIHMVNMEEYKTCFDTIDNIRNVLSLWKEEDQLIAIYQTNRCKIMVYNRNDQVTEAVDCSLENIKILNNEKIEPEFKKQYLYSAKRSVGNTYFYSTIAHQKCKEITESWNDSFNSFIDNYGFDLTRDFNKQPKVAAFAKGLAADIISGNEDLADQKAQFFINAFDKMNMMYYEMQIRLLYSIYLIWKWSDNYSYSEHLHEINRYIDQSIDIAAIYGRELTTINAFHLKAVAFYINKDYMRAVDNYLMAADMLLKYLQSERDYDRWDYFWVDLARSLRKSDMQAIIAPWKKQYPYIYGKLYKILEMNADEYARYEESYEPSTALTDKRHTINFPKI